MSNKTRFHVTVTTLSPLHIGSGGRLREGFDFIEHGGALWVVLVGHDVALLVWGLMTMRPLLRMRTPSSAP